MYMYINVIFTYEALKTLHMLTVGQKTLWTANKHMYVCTHINSIDFNSKRLKFILLICFVIKFFYFLIKLLTNQTMSK